MNQQKPKKALRGLFTRTEPAPRREEAEDSDAILPVTPSVEVAPSRKTAPIIEAVPFVEEAGKVTTLVEMQEELEPASALSSASFNAAETVTTLSPVEPVKGLEGREGVGPVEVIQAVTVLAAAASSAGCDVTSLSAEAPQSPVEALASVVNGFNASVLDRSAWAEDQYLTFIRRIDQAQTEAFLLKGKLLEEVKRRFFVDNKQGWKRFCDDRLDMNYTTANQYIRVAEEFDSLARERPDFGFEHFKALLPLPAEHRTEILARSESLSVKTIRRLVQEKMAPALSAEQAQNSQEARSLVRNLEQLKEQILVGNYGVLPQLARWQLAAACQNLSEELHSLASMLNKSSRDASGRIGASASEGETAL